jgi:hypothetical protein
MLGKRKQTHDRVRFDGGHDAWFRIWAAHCEPLDGAGLFDDRDDIRSGCCVSGSQIVPKKESKMLFMIVAVLVVLWLLGLVAGIAGGFIHLVLLVAVGLFLLQLVQGRRTA